MNVHSNYLVIVVCFIFGGPLFAGKNPQQLVCGINKCRAVFFGIKKLGMHRYLHTDQKPFSCSVCDFVGFRAEVVAHFKKGRCSGSLLPTILTDQNKAILMAEPRQNITYFCAWRGCTSKSHLLEKIIAHRRKKHTNHRLYRCSNCGHQADKKQAMSHVLSCRKTGDGIPRLVRNRAFATARAILTHPPQVRFDGTFYVGQPLPLEDATSIEYISDSSE